LVESMKSSVSASGVRNEAEPPRCAARAWAWDMADSGCNRVSYTAADVQCGGGDVLRGMVVVLLLRDNARGQ
jgi:hypothetical protein